MENQKYIIRTSDNDIHFAEIESRIDGEAVLRNSRRIWYWSGAASTSQLAVDGVANPNECKFTIVVPKMTIRNIVEIIPCTEKATESLSGVKVWRR